jgi:hypothetical protein
MLPRRPSGHNALGVLRPIPGITRLAGPVILRVDPRARCIVPIMNNTLPAIGSLNSMMLRIIVAAYAHLCYGVFS